MPWVISRGTPADGMMQACRIGSSRDRRGRAALDDLHDRLRRARWPERETVGDWSQGVPLNYLQGLCRH